VRLLDRYLLRELLVPLGYCLGGFLIFYIAFDLIFQINRFLDNHLLFLDIVEYYVVTLPELLVEQVLPVSLLLALLYATTNHSRHNELTAMRAAGVGLWRLALPYLGVGVLFGAAVFLISEYWMPSADERAKFILERRQAEPAQRDWRPKLNFYNEATQRWWGMDRFNRRTSEAIPLRIMTREPDGSTRMVEAQRGLYDGRQWRLYEVKTWVQPPSAPFPNNTASNAMLCLTLPETPAWIRSEIKFSALTASDAAKGPQFSIREILDYLRLHPRIESGRKAMLLTQLHGRIAAPFTCLAVVLIALPFGARSGRRNVFVGVAASIFICFGYFILQRISFGLGVGGYLPPVLAAWLPNILCGGAGLALLARLR
jgi:lipopolysaccharide export system permease protein